jgi:murein DD-endopeptidase MepM/ murein hydrolase activator NlpD
VSITNGIYSSNDIELDASGLIVYIVQEGDTLSQIAENFDISINTIRWENDLGKNIKPGQELKILPVSGVRHTIKKGDTFSKIARTYDVETEDITVYNDIKDTELVPGKMIIIPNGTKRKNIITKITTSSKSSIQISTKSSSSGYYTRPTGGRITSRFGPRKGTYHYGVDYGAPRGTPIVAAADGTVLKTSCGSGYGKCLVLQHSNGTQTLYAHANAIYVGVGSKVKQGQKIAAVGSTGRSTGPHLHFEIIESNGKKRNVNFLR